MTADAIGEAIGLSPTGVVRRRKKLRQSGVILREIAIVDPKALGYPERFIVFGGFDNPDPAGRRRFLEALVARGEVVRALTVLGETDFVLEVVARDGEAYRDFLRELEASSTGIARSDAHGAGFLHLRP